MIRLAAFSCVLLAGCSKTATVPVAAPVAPARQVVPSPVPRRDSDAEKLRAENVSLRTENADLKAQVAQAKNAIGQWQAWAEKQSKAQARPPAPAKASSSMRDPRSALRWLSMRDIAAGQEGRLEVNGVKDLPRVTVLEVVAGDSMLVRWGQKDYLIVGIPTNGVVDRSQFDLSGVYQVGTKRLDGGETVFTLTLVGK